MAPWLRPRLSAMARCGSLFSSRSRNNSRILRIDSLSAGILSPAVRAKGASLPSVENCRRRGPLHRHAALITSTGFDDHVRPEHAIEQDHRRVKQRIAVMLGFTALGMRRSRSLVSSYCTASGRDSSDWDVWLFRAKPRLRSGTPCLGLEFSMARTAASLLV